MEELRIDTNSDRNDELSRCRRELKHAIDDELLVLMVVRGAGSTKLADHGKDRSDHFPDREIVWVTDDEILDHPNFSHLFGGREKEIVAVFIDLDNDPGAWLKADASRVKVDRAFRKAGRGAF